MSRRSSLATRERLIGKISRTVLGSILAISVAIVIARAATGEYARPDLLAATDWLALRRPTARAISQERSTSAGKPSKTPTTSCMSFLPRNSPA